VVWYGMLQLGPAHTSDTAPQTRSMRRTRRRHSGAQRERMARQIPPQSRSVQGVIRRLGKAIKALRIVTFAYLFDSDK
jgi:hypothetical protein